MIEVSIATVGLIIAKVAGNLTAAILLAVFILWPRGEQPTGLGQKVTYVIALLLTTALIWGFIKLT